MITVSNFTVEHCRVGAAMLLTDHSTCKLEDTLFRGRWDTKGISSGFCYIGGIINPITNAGKALSGWKDSRMSVQQPDCSTRPADFMIKVNNLIVNLFQSSIFDMDPDGRLWKLAKCTFTFLVYYSTMRIKYPSHPTLSILNEKCNECDIRVNVLLEWGVQIGNIFKMDNIKAVMHGGESLIPFLLERVVILEDCVTSQKQVRI